MKIQSCLHRRHIFHVVASHSIMQIMFKDNNFIKEILLQPIGIVCTFKIVLQNIRGRVEIQTKTNHI